jgi:TetR/AcrR family transcriptional regulator, transcriptional repressor of bet genes
MPKLGMEPIRRAQIRKAAVKLIAKRGFDGTTLMDVALAAGTSTGTISHYYDSKLSMLLDTLTYISESSLARLRKAIALESSPTEKLRALIRAGIFDKSKEAAIGNTVWIWALAEAIRSKEMQFVIQERRRLFQAIFAEVFLALDVGAQMSEAELREFCAECDAYFCGLSYHRLTGEMQIDQESVERSILSMALARCTTDRAVAHPIHRGKVGVARAPGAAVTVE